MALVFPSSGWEQLRDGAQETTEAGSPPHCGTVRTKAPRPLLSLLLCWPLSTPCSLQVLPHSSRQQETPAAAQTSNSSSLWAGGVGGEARGQRAKVSFVPAGGGEGLGVGGETRVGPLTATLRVCEFLCPSGCVSACV